MVSAEYDRTEHACTDFNKTYRGHAYYLVGKVLPSQTPAQDTLKGQEE